MPAGKNPNPRKKIQNTPTFHYKIGEYILLPEILDTNQILFFTVLKRRRSTRSFGKLSLNELSTLLWHSAKVQKLFVSENGAILSHRPAPSAGGIHPIDVFVSLPTLINERKLLLYDPIGHRLGRLIINPVDESSFFEEVNNCLQMDNGTLIWFGAYMASTALKYHNPESLVWRDAGALLMTFQLVATALGIASCPVGTLGEPFFFNSLDKMVLSSGGVLVGKGYDYTEE
ncbi:MAG: nitroreductase family protein [Candidatus Pseudobacter hemicellulosilyticus]|uniref:Nitroreductase family protein n=1 Tax=Candidatus Pseudobacter hemicellulosilyticus TaxID=3121375 RepID=A0AAJ5WQJ3_9BACT|nr:MAG: nitroreductase family protein [Pseudobacter sp.]